MISNCFRLIYLCSLFGVGLCQAQTSFEENIKPLIKNNVHSIKSYKYETGFNDSVLTPKYLFSKTIINKTKENIVFKRAYVDRKDSLHMLKEWEEHYNKRLQIILDFDKSFDAGSLLKYRYDKKGRLIEEVYTLNEKKRTIIDSTKYFYNAEGKLTNSVLKSFPYKWAKDTFIYNKGNLLKKVHTIPIDLSPSLTNEEDFETLYYYDQRNILKSRLITYHYEESFTIDSLYYDEGILIKQLITRCQTTKNCVAEFEYRFNRDGSLIGMTQYTYPNVKLAEIVKTYNSKGLLISSIFVDYVRKRRSIEEFVYQ
jgi:YD repeat-containing protein